MDHPDGVLQDQDNGARSKVFIGLLRVRGLVIPHQVDGLDGVVQTKRGGEGHSAVVVDACRKGKLSIARGTQDYADLHAPKTHSESATAQNAVRKDCGELRMAKSRAFPM